MALLALVIRQPVVLRAGDNRAPANEAGIRAIAAAEPGFDLLGFLDGAKSAYGVILEAFWKGDKDTLRQLTDDDVYDSFAGAIDAREAAGETLDNRLIRIEDATVRSAELDGRTARIAVLFVADIAAVTRDSDGTVIAGSLDDAIESRDVWTFSRHVGAANPNWILDETDRGTNLGFERRTQLLGEFRRGKRRDLAQRLGLDRRGRHRGVEPGRMVEKDRRHAVQQDERNEEQSEVHVRPTEHLHRPAEPRPPSTTGARLHRLAGFLLPRSHRRDFDFGRGFAGLGRHRYGSARVDEFIDHRGRGHMLHLLRMSLNCRRINA